MILPRKREVRTHNVNQLNKDSPINFNVADHALMAIDDQC